MVREVQVRSGGYLEIRLLGGFQVFINGSLIPPEQWKLRKVCGLVKLLALSTDHCMRRDELVEVLWPESEPGSGVNAFHQALHNARQVFGLSASVREQVSSGQILALKGGSLLLAPEWDVRVDVEEFEAAASRLRSVDDPEAYQLTLSIYRGDLLPDDIYEDWASGRREALRQRCLQLLHALTRLYETRQEFPQAIDTFQHLLAMEPADEEAHVGLMRLYARSGQRGLALRQYETLRGVLRELDSEPASNSIQLYEAIQSNLLIDEAPRPPLVSREFGWSTASPPAPQRRLHNLPHRLSTFIGREKEIDRVLGLLRETRLLTITGVGGVGKTSLAVQAAMYLGAAVGADDVRRAFQDGIWLVQLASLADPLLLAETCGRTLEIPQLAGQTAETSLARFLENRHLLLILDNCEHLVDACAGLAGTLLQSCPALSILATSREPLRLPGEIIFSLSPLPIPDSDGGTSLEQLSEVDSLRLFVERARLVSPGFTLSQKNASALALICCRLDGIPLALELAAARTRLLTLQQIADRLDNAFQLLTGGSRAALPRHQTLRVSMEWSYRLLSPAEQLFFASLSIFTGGWTLDAAEEVCGYNQHIADPATVLELLAQLVDKSLVTVVEGAEDAEGLGEQRYTMLETVRQYASERLQETGEHSSRALRDRHLACYARLTAQAAAHWRGPEAAEWMDRLESELPNLYAALEWSLQSAGGRAIELGLQMDADLFEFWFYRLNSQEILRWSERLLAAEATQRGGVPLQAPDFSPNRLLQRARALRFLCHTSTFGHFQKADLLEHLAESEMLLRQIGAAARLDLGITLRMRWNQLNGQDERLKQEFLAIFQQENAQVQLADYHRDIAAFYLGQGNTTQASESLDQILAMYRQLSDWIKVGEVSIVLARALLFQGSYQRARLLVQEAIAVARQLRTRSPEGYYWLILLEIARAEGSYAEGNGYAETALAISRQAKDITRVLTGLWMLAENVWSMGDLDRAQRCADEIMALCQNDSFYREIGHYLNGRIALTRGWLDEAEIQLGESLRWMGGQFWPTQKANHLMGWVILFHKREKYSLAVRIAGAIEDLLLAEYKELSPFERFEYESALAGLHTALSAIEYEAAWAEGKRMTLDQAQDLAKNTIITK